MSMSSEDIDKLQADLEEGLRKTEEKISDINKIIFLEKFASRFFVTWSIFTILAGFLALVVLIRADVNIADQIGLFFSTGLGLLLVWVSSQMFHKNHFFKKNDSKWTLTVPSAIAILAGINLVLSWTFVSIIGQNNALDVALMPFWVIVVLAYIVMNVIDVYVSWLYHR